MVKWRRSKAAGNNEEETDEKIPEGCRYRILKARRVVSLCRSVSKLYYVNPTHSYSKCTIESLLAQVVIIYILSIPL